MSIRELDDVASIYNELLKKMASVDKKYSTTYQEQKVDAPQSLGLEKLSYKMPTEEEILSLAQQYYSSSKQEDVSSVKDGTAKNVETLNQKAKSILDKATQGQIEINQNRENNLKTANYSAQKNNLTNSSIKTGMTNKVNKLAQDALDTLQKTTDNSLADIEEQKSFLEQLSNQKLKELEEIYAQKIALKQEELRASAQKEADAVTKYNNTVDEKEAKYQKSLASQLAELEKQEWKRVAEMLELTERIGESGVAEQKAEEKYRAIRSVLDEFSPSDALAVLESSAAFKTHLGDLYDSLRAYYSSLAE